MTEFTISNMDEDQNKGIPIIKPKTKREQQLVYYGMSRGLMSIRKFVKDNPILIVYNRNDIFDMIDGALVGIQQMCEKNKL